MHFSSAFRERERGREEESEQEATVLEIIAGKCDVKMGK